MPSPPAPTPATPVSPPPPATPTPISPPPPATPTPIAAAAAAPVLREMREGIVGVDLAPGGFDQLGLLLLRRCIFARGPGRYDLGGWRVAGIGIPRAQHDHGAQAEAGDFQPTEEAAARQPSLAALVFWRRSLLFSLRIIAHVMGSITLCCDGTWSRHSPRGEKLSQPGPQSNRIFNISADADSAGGCIGSACPAALATRLPAR